MITRLNHISRQETISVPPNMFHNLLDVPKNACYLKGPDDEQFLLLCYVLGCL